MSKPVGDVQSLFREYIALERKRTREGVTPLEYQRWRELAERLHKHLSAGAPRGSERRDSVRTTTRVVAEFKSPGQLRRALIRNLSGTGVFVSTPFAPEIGTELVLRVRIASSGRVIDLPGVVVSHNVGDGFETGELGMGVRFRSLDDDQQRAIEELRLLSLADSEDTTQ
jgi:hypothetical protein